MQSQEQAIQSDGVKNVPSSLLISAAYNSQQKKIVVLRNFPIFFLEKTKNPSEFENLSICKILIVRTTGTKNTLLTALRVSVKYVFWY